MKSDMKGSEICVLLHISQHGPKTGYALGKETQYSQRVSYLSAKELVQRRLLSPEVVAQTRAGQDMINYNLTLSGLVTVLWVGILMADIQKTIEGLVEHWSHLLPLILGRWSLFETHHVKEFVRNILIILTPLFLDPKDALESYSGKPLLDFYSKCTVDDIHRAFFRAAFAGVNKELSKYKNKWLQVCHNDDEISAFLIEDMNKQKKEKTRQLRELQHELQLLQKED